jgi:hypothetical protein
MPRFVLHQLNSRREQGDGVLRFGRATLVFSEWEDPILQQCDCGQRIRTFVFRIAPQRQSSPMPYSSTTDTSLYSHIAVAVLVFAPAFF